MRLSFDELGDVVGPGIPRRPTVDRVFAVAAGLSDWNEEEQAWIAENPKWLEYCASLKQTIKQADKTARSQLPPDKVFADCVFHI